jgi:UbiD family decarboxylase
LSFIDLRAFLVDLERAGDLVRIRVPVDPNQEMTIIQHRIMAAKGPALLFENVSGSPFRVVTNLFGTRRRTRSDLRRRSGTTGPSGFTDYPEP